MRKTLLIILLLANAIPQNVRAFSYTYQGQTLYYYLNGNTATVTSPNFVGRYTNLAGNLVIPDSVQYNSVWYPVTSIGPWVFSHCSELTSVTIGNSVTSIGKYAFINCSSLSSVTIPNSVTSIGNGTFSGCNSLTSVTIPNSVTSIGNCAFWGCGSLTSFSFPNSVTSIGDSTLYNCSSLTSVTIPNSITSIGVYAFYLCSSLSSVTIPNSITSIGSSAFEGCSGLTSVTIPNSVTSIGYSAFEGCSSLTSVTIPNSVTSIGNYAFNGCNSLTSVTIGNSVTSIGNCAFSGCSSLTATYYTGTIAQWCAIIFGYGGANPISYSHNIYVNNTLVNDLIIPNSVTSIGQYAFYSCNSLSSVTIPSSVTLIGSSAFSGCNGLTSVTIPNTVTSIGSSAFSGVRHIEYHGTATGSPWDAYSMNGYTEGDFVYTDSTKHHLTAYVGSAANVTIPSTVDRIGYNAFRGCRSLISVTIPNSVTSIGSSAFSGCNGLTSVTIPNSVTSIGSSAFSGCNGLTSVTIPNSVTSIGNSAFYNCSSLTSVTIPNSVTSIGYSAFEGCSSLTSVTIPNSVASIGSYAFSGCSSLASVTIPNSVTSIGSHAFSEVRHIEYHGTATGSPWGAYSMNGYTEGDFVYTDSTKHHLTAYVGSAANVTIPSTVDSIGYYAFRGCSGLTSVIIPNSVTSIGYSAFKGCSSLTSVIIPNSVTSIGNSAFYNCSSLTSVIIPNSVTSIGNYAFSGCNSLTSVTIGNSVTTIGSSAFIGCSSLTSVTIPNSVTSIGSYAFYGCSSLTSVTIPNSVTSIENNTFYGCSGLTSVTIPNSVTIIRNSAFENCSSLTSITIPRSVKYISEDAFYRCTGLTSVMFNADSCWNAGSRGNGDFCGQSAFNECINITNFVFGENVKEIPNFICAGLSSLVTVTISDSVSYIGEQAFKDCSNLSATYYTGTVAQWCAIDFYHWASNPIVFSSNLYINDSIITNLVIPDSVTSIGRCAFYGCDSLTSVIVPNSVTSIGVWAFQGCSGLISVAIGNSVTNIGSEAFYGCSNLTSVTIDRCPPPTLGSSSFPSNTNISVPCSCVSDYMNNSSYSNYNISGPEYNYTVAHSEHGTVGVVEYGCQITLTATADAHCHFLHWEDGSTDNPRTVTLSQDSAFMAFFAVDTHTVTVVSADPSQGSVSGGGMYEYGSSHVITATGEPGHHFVRWNGGNTNNPRTITVHGDATYTAYFAIDTLTVNVSSNDITYGSVTGGGTFVYGTPCTLTATAYSGYMFVRWSNGVTYNPYTFAVLTNMDIEATFAPEGSIHNVVVQVQPSGTGTVTGDGPYADGETATLEAIANEGWHFVRWSDNVTSNPRTVTVTSDISLTAYFASDNTQDISYIDGEEGVMIWTSTGSIHIAGCEGERVQVYDMMGRTLFSTVSHQPTIDIPNCHAGVYVVRVGSRPARKVAVVR